MAIEDRGPELAITTVVFLGLSSVTVFLRCYVKLFLLKAFRTEDWLALGTLATFIVYATFVLMSIQNGAGKHAWDVAPEEVPRALKMRWAGELAYVVTSLFLKFTIGVFLLRICSQTWQRAVIWTVLLVCLIFNLFYTFIAAFQCSPVTYFWLQYKYAHDSVPGDGRGGECLDENIVLGSTYAAAAINAVADWTLGLLPIALVWNLDLNRRAKFSVAGVLALGSIASSATIVRIPYIWQLAHDNDVLYEFSDLALWSTIENGLGLTVSSIATLRPLFRHFLGHPYAEPTRHSSSSYTSWTRRRRSTWGRRRANDTTNSIAFHCRGHSDDMRNYRTSSYYRMEMVKHPGTGSNRTSAGTVVDAAPSPAHARAQSDDSYFRQLRSGYDGSNANANANGYGYSYKIEAYPQSPASTHGSVTVVGSCHQRDSGWGDFHLNHDSGWGDLNGNRISVISSSAYSRWSGGEGMGSEDGLHENGQRYSAGTMPRSPSPQLPAPLRIRKPENGGFI
ncbi:hypothetical protein F4780DRAFT_550800 [Xylariomycetidae sp. FL0641]|nr:hypothetical protein F4780DRAFT_550800 [Xylariomycetidae sp. FL0641]